MSNLAIFGGKPVRTKPFPSYNTIGEEEKAAVMEVMDTGRLSDYIGRHCELFGGGKKVKELETLVQKKFGVKHAVSMNSATSCLYAAAGALGLGAGLGIVSLTSNSTLATFGLVSGIGLGVILAGIFIMVATIVTSYTSTAYHTCLYLWARDVEKARASGSGAQVPAPAPLAAVLNR